ncbi:hypothetical protein ACV1CZ_19400, partial [Aeromonas caviae]
KQAGKWDQETIVSFFLCQYCSGEYLPPGDGDFLHLGAGEQSQADADLAQAYDLSQPGRYRLSYRAQPLTLTKGVAPSCPAVDFTRVAP